ncbi:MAG: hypothetical protein QOE28_1390 [Solirubrobacteraceae bacterium]|nr:hypothetical protein [Solirubrobacteraceae bacterium]
MATTQRESTSRPFDRAVASSERDSCALPRLRFVGVPDRDVDDSGHDHGEDDAAEQGAKGPEAGDSRDSHRCRTADHAERDRPSLLLGVDVPMADPFPSGL